MKKKFANILLVCSVLFATMMVLTGCKEKYENIRVYLNDGLSESKIIDIQEKIKSYDEVNSITYTSKEEALKEAREKLRRRRKFNLYVYK